MDQETIQTDMYNFWWGFYWPNWYKLWPKHYADVDWDRPRGICRIHWLYFGPLKMTWYGK